MWEIYKCAEQVLIWLGEPSSEVSTVPGWSSLLSRALRRPEDINRIKRNRANKEYSDNRRDRRRGSRPLPCEHGHYMTAQEATEDARREIRSSAEDGELQLIREILALPWFRRRWIVQEVLFSCRTIALYGYHDFDFYDLLPAAMIFQKDHALIPQVLAGAKKTYQDQGVLRIMHDFDGHDCTDARDKVYAMMRLSSDFYLAPDYTATVESVYIDTAVLHRNRTFRRAPRFGFLQSFQSMYAIVGTGLAPSAGICFSCSCICRRLSDSSTTHCVDHRSADTTRLYHSGMFRVAGLQD
jgi:hypothetical protein